MRFTGINSWKYLLWSVALSGWSFSCSASDRPYPRYQEADQENRELYDDAQMRIVIGYTGIGIPNGRILLIRKDKRVCAIRFSKVYYEGSYQKPSSLAYFAEYQWFYHEEGAGQFSAHKLRSGRGQLYQKATGYGHPFDWSTSNVVECESFRLGWNRPSTVWFHQSTDKKGEQGNELAPTKWTDISEIDTNDPRLKWYRYGQVVNELFIPVEQLW